MAGKLFVGFDLSQLSNSLGTGGISLPSATIWNGYIVRPKGFYHNRGVPTLDPTLAPPNGTSGTSSSFWVSGRTAGAAYGNASGITTPYTGATSTTRAVWATAQGHQLATVRSEIGIGNELWMSFDAQMGGPNAASITSAYQPSASWGKIFVWGDVELVFKSQTFAASVYEWVFSVRNNGVEVATITVPSIASRAEWLYFKIHVKLDATAGIIEMAVSGNAQSVAFASGNTVNTTSLASATAVFFGPPVADDGTTAYVGYLDNVYFDNAAFSAGRIHVLSLSAASDNTLTNFAAVGTSPTTVTAALSNYSDTTAGRATASGGSAVLNISAPGTTGLMSDVVGVDMVAKFVTNRNSMTQRRVSVGYSLSAVETMGVVAKTYPLAFASNTTPPNNSDGVIAPDQVFTKTGGGLMTTTELATMKYVIKSVAP